MFISSEEKKLILDVLDLLEKRLEMLTERVERIEAAPYGFKKDGTPRAKPGVKPGASKK